jgi:hypothetical protein
MYSMRQNIQYWNEKTNNITLSSSASLFLIKETNIHNISVLIYHGMRYVSVRSVHRLAVDKRTCAFEMREFQYCIFWRILYFKHDQRITRS